MNRPTLFVHAGSHKTGTTAIQETLHAAAGELRLQGICWPVLGPSRGHSRLVRAIHAGDWRSRLKARWLAARIRHQARGLPTAVLSSEKIYRIGYEFFGQSVQNTPANRARRVAVLRDLRALFADQFDIRVLLYLRRVDEFAESMYKELLFRKPYADRFPFDQFLNEQAQLFDYRDQVEELRQCLGPVSLLSYDEARRTGLIAHFCAQLGARPPAAANLDRRVRLSASNTAAIFLDRLAAERRLTHVDRLQLLDFALTGGLTDPEGATRSLWPSRASLEEFMSRHGAPELDSLFPAIDFERMRFDPMDDHEYRARRAEFDEWSRRRT